MACPKCGDPGLHACLGKPIPPWTPEETQRLQVALQRIKTLKKGSLVEQNQNSEQLAQDAKWDGRTLGASEEHVAVVKRSEVDAQAIAAAGVAHVDLDPALSNPAGAVAEEEDDFLAGKKACSIDNPECEACQ